MNLPRLRDSRRPQDKDQLDSAGHQNFTDMTTIFTVKPSSSTTSSPTTSSVHLPTPADNTADFNADQVREKETEDTEGGNGEETSRENRPYTVHQYCPYCLYCAVSLLPAVPQTSLPRQHQRWRTMTFMILYYRSCTTECYQLYDY